MLLSKKGAALLQVLLVTAVLAGIATLLLRVSISHAKTSRTVRRQISAQMLIESCATEVNAFWMVKSPETFARDIEQCIMYCNSTLPREKCPEEDMFQQREFHCRQTSLNGANYNVTARIEDSGTEAGCKITYTISDAQNL